MEFKYFSPSDTLKPYVRHYYLFESEADVAFEDTVFPSGGMEMIFNLGQGIWETSNLGKTGQDTFSKNPSVELWGQITKPLVIRSKGRHCMLGVKFFTHSAAYFLHDEIGLFNDWVYDLGDVVGNQANALHTQLLETTEINGKIALIERFLLKRLREKEKKIFAIDKVAHILSSLTSSQVENSVGHTASKHGISTRYMHKLIYQNTGLSPVSFQKINRFQLSLGLLSKKDIPLTAIAYDSGYFDQSHFIRDFKAFTGLTPSAYLEGNLPVNQVMMP